MEPASIRYKNPGAMWGSPTAIKWGARQVVNLNDGKGQGNNIAVFKTYVDGICAQLDLWRSSRNYKNKQFCDAIRVWSGGNEVESYISFVLKRVPGMTRGTVMNDEFWRGPMCIPFLKAQAWHEAGKQYPAPDADWLEAKRRVFEGNAKVPPPPDVEPAPSKPSKPAIQSTTVWAQIAAVLTTLGSAVSGFLSTWQGQVAAVIIIGAIAVYVIRERKKQGDIGGWLS